MKGEIEMIGKRGIIAGMLVCGLMFVLTADAEAQQDKLLREAKEALEAADPYMGDWQGSWTTDDGADTGSLIAQVLALGKEGYRANFHVEFEYEWPPLFVLSGRSKGSSVPLNGRAEFDGNVLDIESVIEAGKFKGKFKGIASDGQNISGTFTMAKTIRLSPTLGAKPPEGAVVLLAGKPDVKCLEKWQAAGNRDNTEEVRWELRDGALEVKRRTGGIITKQEFGDCKLHVEFRTPFMPDARGQGRGNSGVYLQGRYEVQMLDSYGLQGMDNECGGIYRVEGGRPEVNMCAPPTQWQTYDIKFRAPRFNEEGEKIAPARLTVEHNGVPIQNEVKPKGPTTAAPDRTEKGPGGLYLQDHGNPVQFRNIWLVKLPPENP